MVQLPTPLKFFNDQYDQIYINTNGILTFVTEFPEFINQPFPLEYPAIAPFYSNIDTSVVNLTQPSAIVYFQSVNVEKLQKSSDLVRYGFQESGNFQASHLYVTTWQNVGYFNGKTDKRNSFQVIIICNENETYVQFTYLKNGLNWLHGDIGSSGLSDIRAQAGFMSENGQLFTLNGSGTENVRYLSSLSNIGIPGVWLYKVGPLHEYENIQEPNLYNENENELTHKPETCRDGLYRNCHTNAICIDNTNTAGGYCCQCNNGYYGNGFSCIKNTIPIRVTGSIHGQINNKIIDDRAKLQSYIVLADGRSYTAINPIGAEEGQQLALAIPIGSAIGWLFAKSQNSSKNGYDITGGQLTHYSILKFPNHNNEIFYINQTFNGLNYWDQLTMDIELNGQLPYIPIGTKFLVSDYIEEYYFISKNQIQLNSQNVIEIPSENRRIQYELQQIITFDKCEIDAATDAVDNQHYFQKISKLNIDYSEYEQALRIGLLVKVGINPNSNPCTDGTAICGENTYCSLLSASGAASGNNDNYECLCQNGYMPVVMLEHESTDIENCVDINECQQEHDQQHICHENAECINTDGGYNCQCFHGYTGNGYECHLNHDDGNYTEHNPQYNPCDDCSSDAICINGNCQCRENFLGDGYYCQRKCQDNEIAINGKCLLPTSHSNIEEPNTVQPDCNQDDPNHDCQCPEHYELQSEENLCYLVDGGGSYDDSKVEESIPCDVDFNCHRNATCDWSDLELRNVCICDRGFEGDGYSCDKIEATCTTTPDLCDDHASCVYNDEIGKSECKCDSGYEGNGFRCLLAPECQTDQHCGTNSLCNHDICICMDGYERDLSDFCVPAGKCGGVYCTDNAMCKWDAETRIQYCECMDGYSGDGIINCKSIPPPCNIRNTCGLYASCVPNYNDYSKFECVCNVGYYGDGYVCVEERNCRNTPSMCHEDAVCSETINGLNCICNQGFLGNGTYCKKITAHDSGFLLLSQGVVIIRVPYNGKFGKPISVASMAIGLDKDCIEGRVYWVDISAKKIMTSKYDGTDLKTIISKDVESPEGIAIDWISRRLYWTDSSKDTIEVASIDNPDQRSIIINKNLVNPRGIAVDPFKQKIYWSDWNREAPKIEMSNLDGSDRVIIASTELILPNSLVILNPGGFYNHNDNDNHNNHGISGELCFADAGTHEIKCIDTDNQLSRTIARNLSYPFGLTIDNDSNFYWTDWITKQIESVDINGIRRQGIRTPVFGSHKMYGMTAITESCPLLHSVCSIDNGGCKDDRLCLANDKLSSYKTCQCTKLSKFCNFNNNMDLE